MFHFADELYMTDKISPEINRIKFKLYSGIGLLNVCLITFSVNDNDIFDIYPATYFKQKNIRKRDFYVLGIAESKDAAIDMISNMIIDCINKKSEDISIKDYYRNKVKW